MKTIGVIGAGVMGRGVAQSFAQAGHKVILVDISEEVLDTAAEEIYNQIRMLMLFKKVEGLEAPEIILERIHRTTSLEELREADIIVENVNEQWEVKKEVYVQIDPICQEDCIYLVNTSCISITKIAALTKRPDRVIGTHFMNPVPLKSAVEVIKGMDTSEQTIEVVTELLSSIGKETILVNDYPGFVSNRISHLFMNEAAFVLQDQVASAREVDDIFVKCYGHTMGPLETADLIGLDTVMDSLDVLYESYQDPKFRCCPLLRKMVHAGRTGRKSGEGFYSY
ncbi:3-hydroxyacyl-CoA dehydrogenase NAD-binding domain-containing protein [Paenibacillus sp. FSL R7-0652]|jgi:3-hydroxybutyryl-CoA dehydrogenase|uniref:3-hydroxyacyl-CoA dehydrogenase NAD-binding domain-containing protein n=1 Tax=Paenibacillus sp. AN1007 TaxID=3151385 RepID=A0AAU8NED4_9BACL